MRIREARRRMAEAGELAAFYRALVLEVAAGLPLDRALAPFAAGAVARPVRERARTLAHAVRSGRSLEDGMAASGSVFWPLERTLLALGEERGRLEEVTGLLGRFFDADHRVARAIRGRAVLPALYGGAAAVILPLPLLFHGPAWVYGLVAVSGLAATALLGTGAALAWFEARREAPREAMARLCWALAAALELGLSTDRALILAAEASAPSPVSSALARLPASLRHGVPLSRALRASGRVPAVVLASLENAERSGETRGTLRHLASLCESGALGSALRA